jgi:2-keto-4-pentenoate hydratase
LTNAQDAARALNAARQSRQLLRQFPVGLLPQEMAEAHRIQDESAKLHGGIGGWKIVPIKPDGSDPNCASIGANLVLASPATMEKISPQMAVEVEVALKIGEDLPSEQAPFDAARVRKAIGSAHIAFEVVGSRFEDAKSQPDLARSADSGSNVAIIVGDEIDNWADLGLDNFPMELSVDGKAVANKSDGATAQRLVDTVVWLANHAAQRCGGLKSGQVILTGARISPTKVAVGQTLVATASGKRVALTIR